MPMLITNIILKYELSNHEDYCKFCQIIAKWFKRKSKKNICQLEVLQQDVFSIKVCTILHNFESNL